MSVNVLQNGKIVKLAGAVESDVIDQAVELATKQAVATAAAYAETIVAQAGGFHTKVVERLPLGAADPEDEEFIMTNTLYFVPNGAANAENAYDEYMYIGEKWELINDKVRLAAFQKIEEQIGKDKEVNKYKEQDNLVDIINLLTGTKEQEGSLLEQIYSTAAAAAYKQREDGSVETIEQAIAALEEYRDNFLRIEETQVDKLFE